MKTYQCESCEAEVKLTDDSCLSCNAKFQIYDLKIPEGAESGTIILEATIKGKISDLEPGRDLPKDLDKEDIAASIGDRVRTLTSVRAPQKGLMGGGVNIKTTKMDISKDKHESTISIRVDFKHLREKSRIALEKQDRFLKTLLGHLKQRVRVKKFEIV